MVGSNNLLLNHGNKLMEQQIADLGRSFELFPAQVKKEALTAAHVTVLAETVAATVAAVAAAIVVATVAAEEATVAAKVEINLIGNEPPLRSACWAVWALMVLRWTDWEDRRVVPGAGLPASPDDSEWIYIYIYIYIYI
jgi:hypothetical protein